MKKKVYCTLNEMRIKPCGKGIMGQSILSTVFLQKLDAQTETGVRRTTFEIRLVMS